MDPSVSFLPCPCQESREGIGDTWLCQAELLSCSSRKEVSRGWFVMRMVLQRDSPLSWLSKLTLWLMASPNLQSFRQLFHRQNFKLLVCSSCWPDEILLFVFSIHCSLVCSLPQQSKERNSVPTRTLSLWSRYQGSPLASLFSATHPWCPSVPKFFHDKEGAYGRERLQHLTFPDVGLEAQFCQYMTNAIQIMLSKCKTQRYKLECRFTNLQWKL